LFARSPAIEHAAYKRQREKEENDSSHKYGQTSGMLSLGRRYSH
jgi:hypothetical protein